MAWRVPSFELQSQYLTLKGEIDSAIARVLASGWFVLGPELEAFESAFAEWLGMEHAVGVGNGADALALALRAVGVMPGDKVVTAANTCVPTVTAICQAGAVPVLVDCLPGNLSMDMAQAAAAIKDGARAVVPVHLYGHPCDMDALQTACDGSECAIVEDCAQAHGATFRGRPCGTFGAAAAFSFYPTKNLGAYGDGGAVVTRDPVLAQRVHTLRFYGDPGNYQHEEIGVNSRLDPLQAAILSVKLPHLNAWTARRRVIARRYDAAFRDLPVRLLEQTAHAESCHHLYPIRTDKRDTLQAHLATLGIQSQIHYPSPIHLLPAYRHLGHAPGDFPVAEEASRMLLSLPIYPELSDESQDEVIATVCAFFRA